nr:hypothetical protein [Propionibacterium sp.]
MTARRPGNVLAGGLPAETESLPPVDGLSTSGFATLIDRGIALFCLVTLVPSVITAYGQLQHVDPAWLAIVGGALVAVSVLMPYYAWSRRGIRRLAGLYAAVVLVGLVTWPLAWSGDGAATGAIMLWMEIGLATVCVAVAANAGLAAGYGVVCAVVFFLVRGTPAGGSASPLLALQDALVVVVQPAVTLLILHYLRERVLWLDAALAADQAATADAAVNQALVDERRRLDAIVHDEIMTTLVAGAQSRTPHDRSVAEQARRALAWLGQEAAADEDDSAAVSADQLVRLIKDATAGVCPRAEVLGEIPAAAVTIPQQVVRVLMRAVREAALNCEKHSAAEHVQVLVTVTASARRVSVRISVTDDGVGFLPDAVPPQRLGLRVAIGEWMQTVGGRLEVSSAPGRGTTVRLTWSGERSRPVERPVRRTQADAAQHPLFRTLDPRPIVAAVVVLALVHALLGATTLPQLRRPELLLLGMAVMVVGLVLGIRAMLWPPITVARGWLQAGLAVGVTLLCLLALEGNEAAGLPWPEHGTWYAAIVMMILVVTYTSGQAPAAWVGAAAHAALVAWWGHPLSPSDLLVVALLPVAWLGLAAVFFYWLDAMWAQLDEAEREARESARINAALFGKLVLREVWLAELRAEVGPLLEHLADADRPLTDADRAAFLLMEGSLRDGITAANFNAPGLGAAIMDARSRGVQVTLVDNRGSRLPEAARRAALRTLEQIVRSADSGRIVARTAPEGYDEAVTILRAGQPGETQLTRIGETGRVETAS